MRPSVNPNMLTIARETRGFTQSDLAQRTGIKQSSISKYENGALRVSPNDLQLLAEALHYPINFFLLPEVRYHETSATIFHRKRKNMLKADLRVIHAKLNLYRIQTARLLMGVEVESFSDIPQVHLSDFNGDVEKVAQFVRQEWNLPPGPVSNLVEAIEDAGGIVFMASFDTDQLDAISQYVPGSKLPPLFYLNADTPADRLRFTLAHELGHIVMHHQQTNEANVEEEADRFAAEFLMPEQEIGTSLYALNIPKLTRLKGYWKVSMGAILRRARDIGKITDRQYRNLWEQMSRLGFRKREPGIFAHEEPTVLYELFKIHIRDHGLTYRELSHLLVIHENELKSNYDLGDLEAYDSVTAPAH